MCSRYLREVHHVYFYVLLFFISDVFMLIQGLTSLERSSRMHIPDMSTFPYKRSGTVIT